MSEITAFNGTRVALTEQRWKHALVRHSELEDKINKIGSAIYSGFSFGCAFRRSPSPLYLLTPSSDRSEPPCA